jgi:hypothetical protein
MADVASLGTKRNGRAMPPNPAQQSLEVKFHFKG